MDEYQAFVKRKLSTIPPTGIADNLLIPESLFPHQRALVQWALRRGRCAIFADTGLGKSRMQLAWASEVLRHIGCRVLILAPLAVAAQTVGEGAEIGVAVVHVREQSEVGGPGIYITNYDRLHLFDASAFGAVVLDESSCIKHHTARTFSYLCEAFQQVAFKLCATATPAPNDWSELGTHAEFLGICTRAEMLAEYFIHDGAETQVWRLKGHARAQFWRWVSTWGAMVRKPSDLGFDDSRYVLPPIQYFEHTVKSDGPLNGMLFAMQAQTLSERRDARRQSIGARVLRAAEVIKQSRTSPQGFAEPPNTWMDQWVVWVELNAEQDALAALFGKDCVSIYGSLTPEEKVSRYALFKSGAARVLITKPSIFGYGVNMQFSCRCAFVGVTDSFEAFYQTIRRQWRFGQSRPVQVHIFASDLEGAVVKNLRRKEADALAMAESLSAETREAVMQNVIGLQRATNTYNATSAVALPSWLKTEV